jgi:hypothetical protein
VRMPRAGAHSEVAENIAQLARFLVLRRLWRWQIDTWGADTAWIQRMIGEAERDQTGFFARQAARCGGYVDWGPRRIWAALLDRSPTLPFSAL